MRLTDRDKLLIELIERWGYMSIDDVCKIFKLKNANSAVWRTKRLVDYGIIKREKSILGCYHYMPHDSRGVNISTLEHNQVVKFLCLSQAERLKCDYITERELLREAAIDGRLDTPGPEKKPAQRIPDFVLIRSADYRVACEVEMSQKTIKRQREIMSQYREALMGKQYKQVWYFCGSEAIKSRISEVIKGEELDKWVKAALIPKEDRP